MATSFEVEGISMKETKYPYTKQIGILDTKQFAKLQAMLEPLNEMERMAILYNQLKLEIEMEDEPTLHQ